jgi:glycosyltransferase involved in cell wall biosynthesis
MKMALELSADIVVTLDSDGQHDPSEIPQVLKPILEGKADMVIGARFMGEYEIPRYRKFGIDTINWLYNVCNSKKLIDTQSCFRAYARELVEKLTIEEDGFGFSTEVLIKIRKMKARMVEVPISCIYHRLEQDSTMNPLKHGFLVAWKTIYWRVKLWN